MGHYRESLENKNSDINVDSQFQRFLGRGSKGFIKNLDEVIGVIFGLKIAIVWSY